MLCTGHGGASRVAPANTLRSFRAAADLRADRIEFDVRAWRGRLLLAHTTVHARVARCLELEEALRELSGARYAGMEFVVDLKTADAAVPAVSAVRRFGLLDRSLFASQCPPHLALVRRHAPRAQTAISIAGRLSRRLQKWGEWRGEVVAALRAGRYDALMAHHRLIDAALVDDVRAAGGELHAWTVDAPGAIRALARLGVDGVVTGDPRLVRAQVAAAATPLPVAA